VVFSGLTLGATRFWRVAVMHVIKNVSQKTKKTKRVSRHVTSGPQVSKMCWQPRGSITWCGLHNGYPMRMAHGAESQLDKKHVTCAEEARGLT